MSLVDDLEAAEDWIATLTGALDDLAREVEEQLNGGAVLRSIPGVQRVLALAASSRAVVDTGWCRPSCDDHDHNSPKDEEAEYCGCPAHGEEGGT